MFSSSQERLRFYTKWTIDEGNQGIISCQQRVEMEGRDEDVVNSFLFSDILPDSFIVELSSDIFGTVMGKGVIDKGIVAWEFRGHPDLEGFEVYELQENGDYMLHAEYAGLDQVRTMIDGRIWKKE